MHFYMKFQPYKYQDGALQHTLQRPYAGLFMDMGLGKTVVLLLAMDILLNRDFEISRPLVVAPKRVAENTWPNEIAKWDQTRHLTYSLIAGTEQQRLAALKRKADIYIIGRDNVAWLVAFYGTHFPFDMLVLDELSSFKNPKANRFRALKMIRPKVKRVVGLTGTPAPNGLMDLWAQIYLLDRGERLGDQVGGYRERYFTPDKRQGAVVFNYKAKKESFDVIYDKISDICISMKTEDYLQLPDRIDIPVYVRLSAETQKKYDDFEAEAVMQLADQEITAVNSAALVTKLLQFANGAIYDEDKNVHWIHNEKLDALSEILEETGSEPVLIFYSYQHDMHRIQERHKHARLLRTNQDIEDWNAGRIKLLVAHPASAGHGLNLQAGGHIMVWFGPTYNLELWMQAIKRIHRQGQMHPVRVFVLLTIKTIDSDVMERIAGKITTQEALIEAVKYRIEKYSKEFV